MAGMAALRAGAGLSTVATAKSVIATVAGFHPELMSEPLDETDAGSISIRALQQGRVDSLAERKTVLAVGPGISRDPETAELVRAVVKKYKLPIVLDADGLNAFENRAAELKNKAGTLVITPHPGEMARLIGSTIPAVQHDRLNVARSFAREHEAIVVLKEGQAATEEELIEFVRGRLAHFKAPKSVEFMESLPKGGTGKILKADLREKYWAGQAKRVH